MGCDMAVALGSTTTTQSAFVGLNYHSCRDESLRLALSEKKNHVADEILHRNTIDLPQSTTTFATLALQSESDWGYQAGMNEHGLVVGNSTWHSLLEESNTGLSGPDLVRLVLERSSTAVQGLDLLAKLISRYGQNGSETSDHIYLITDGKEAFVVEAAGHYWACHEIRQVRAISDVAVIRQDWNRISPGLADEATRREWWTCDGSKIDFVGCFSAEPMGRASALRRWGRTTYLLERQNGSIDLSFFRQLFADHYEDTSFEADPLQGSSSAIPLCQHGLLSLSTPMTRAGLLMELPMHPSGIPVIWVAFGPPCLNAYFPVFLLPGLTADGYFETSQVFRSRNTWQTCSALLEDVGLEESLWVLIRERFCWLQQRMDMDTEEFLDEIQLLQANEDAKEIRRRAALLMQNHLEQFSNVVESVQEAVAQGEAPIIPNDFSLGV